MKRASHSHGSIHFRPNSLQAIDVADKFPDATVYGVDLYPPPNTWVVSGS